MDRSTPGFCHFLLQGIFPTQGSNPGIAGRHFTVWATREAKKKMKVAQSCPTLCNPMDYTSPWNSPGQNTGVGSLSLLQGVFLTQGSNPGLPHHRQILYQLSHRGNPENWHFLVAVQSLSCVPSFCDPMDRSTPGFPVLPCHPEFAQTHVHGVSDAIQPSHPLFPPPFSSCPQSLPVSGGWPPRSFCFSLPSSWPAWY